MAAPKDIMSKIDAALKDSKNGDKLRNNVRGVFHITIVDNKGTEVGSWVIDAFSYYPQAVEGKTLDVSGGDSYRYYYTLTSDELSTGWADSDQLFEICGRKHLQAAQDARNKANAALLKRQEDEKNAKAEKRARALRLHAEYLTRLRARISAQKARHAEARNAGNYDYSDTAEDESDGLPESDEEEEEEPWPDETEEDIEFAPPPTADDLDSFDQDWKLVMLVNAANPTGKNEGKYPPGSGSAEYDAVKKRIEGLEASWRPIQ